MPQIEQQQLLAVIDIGSGAIRMVVAEVGPDLDIRHLVNAQKHVPLGKDVFSGGRIRPETIRQAIEVLRGFQLVMQEYGVNHCEAIATAAVREASNRDTFIDQVFVRTGIDVEVIEGSEENRLEMIAVEHALAGKFDLRRESCLIVEVGSGSTVLIFLDQGEVEATRTLSIGSVKLPGDVLASDVDRAAMRRLLKRSIHESADYVGREHSLSEIETFIALGSDMRFLARRLAEEGRDDFVVEEDYVAFPAGELDRFLREVGDLSIDEIIRRYGLDYDDAETFYPALLYYHYFLQEIAAEQVVVPMVSIRDGLLLEQAKFLSGAPGADLSHLVVSSAKRLAAKYDYDEKHAQRVAKFAGELFNALRDDHGLGSRERLLLVVAAILHEIGMYVSPSSRHKHSLYLIEHSDIFGLRKSDREIVANTARYHRGNTPRDTHPGFAMLNKHDRARVSKLSALLRVAVALDASRSPKIDRIDLDRSREPYEIWVPEEAGDLSLERDALARKSRMFTEVFGVPLVLKQGTRASAR